MFPFCFPPFITHSPRYEEQKVSIFLYCFYLLLEEEF
jgi:hypothetical protein